MSQLDTPPTAPAQALSTREADQEQLIQTIKVVLLFQVPV